MRYNWLSFFGATIIWALKGFEGKLSEVEHKYKYSALIPIIIIGGFIFLIYLMEEYNYLN